MATNLIYENLTTALHEAADALAEGDSQRRALNVGKAAGLVLAADLPGIESDDLFDRLSDAFENEDAGALDEIRKSVACLADSCETDDAESGSRRYPAWDEYGSALNEALEARNAGDSVRYSLMIGLVSGMMFEDGGPRYEDETILAKIVRGYETDSPELLQESQRRISFGIRMTAPIGAVPDEELDSQLSMIQRVQNFGLRIARGGDESVRLPTSTIINQALLRQAQTRRKPVTTKQELSTIKSVDLKDVWEHEARNFTPWISDHISELGEALGLEELESRETEAPVGGFKLDILAHDMERKRPVIIENQLGETDHSHLGQLLTYAAGYEANVVVWIAGKFKDEHREALDLLNRRTDEETEFFGVVIEVWKIDGSRPAPHFKVVSAPNDWQKTNKQPPSTSPKGEQFRAFWQSLMVKLGEEHKTHKAPPENWYSSSSGVSGASYICFVSGKATKGKARVELYLDSDKTKNKQRFHSLEKSKEEIESAIGGELNWERLDDKIACRISAARAGSIGDDEKTLEEIRGWMIEKMRAFKRVFGPKLDELKAAEASQE